MSKKIFLFAGILLLVIGILTRSLIDYTAIGLILILTGVFLKTYYIIMLVIKRMYRPGRELIVLAVGLGLFLTGLYVKRNYQEQDFSIYLIVLGLFLKIMFIIAFIKKVKNKRIQAAK